ncbi:hypothetical protein IAU60_005623 [Kwoniella sp. DSM 27419]
MHQPSLLDSPPSPDSPSHWQPSVNYPFGTVIWHAGTFWRCEAGHVSGVGPAAVPTNNLYLWTPVGSSGAAMPPAHPYYQQSHYYAQQGGSGQPLAYNSSGEGSAQGYYAAPPLAGSQFYAPTATQPGPSTFTPSPSQSGSQTGTPSSDDTVTGPGPDSKRGPGSSSTAFFAAQAKESLRYLTIRQEEHKAKEEDELKHELKGKRVWRVGGVGMWAYSQDQQEEEMKKRLWQKWSDEHDQKDWLQVARERKEFYEKESRGVKPLFHWKLVEKGQRPPPDALPIGSEQDGAALFAARAWWEGGIHLGKAGHHLVNGASISYGGSEKSLETYEVLCGNMNEPYLVKWMTYRHGELAKVEGWQPVEGGREKDGSALLLAKGEYENGQHPGKCLINDDHACVGYGGGELWVRPFAVLAYANPDRR